MKELLDRLAADLPVPEPVALVCAHPDDELVGLGSRLRLFERLTLIHVTDGAPLDMGDARRVGFQTRKAYAAARADESAAGLAVVGARPSRTLRYGVVDQGAVDLLAAIVGRLTRNLTGQTAVFTHAYEGAHPDHDACALAVQLACVRLGDAAPLRLEFAGYFSVGGRTQVNAFHPDPDSPETAVELTPAERALKAEAYAAHASQRETLARFPPVREAWRAAPSYDFTQPPPPSEALYDSYGWSLTSDIWREKAVMAVRALGRS